MLSRQDRLRRYYAKRRLIGGAIIGVLAVIFLCLFLTAEDAVPASAGAPKQHSVNVVAYFSNWRGILGAGIPGLEKMNEKTAAITEERELNAKSFFSKAVMFCTSIDVKDIHSIFSSEIPILSMVNRNAATVSASNVPNFPSFDAVVTNAGGKPFVGVYHTHSSESFIPSAGVAHKPGGQIGDIAQVGQALCKRLEKYNVAAVQSMAVHDYPSFMKAYGPSEITAKKMLQDNPSIQMLFDIHRDADKKENATATINGVQAAKITIVVAVGQQDLVQPHWQQNHAFAKLIDAKLNQHYPGLSRGIQMQNWRYNQHLHPRALLLEVGCQETTMEEAVRSMEMLGDVLAEIIAENQYQK
jgi:stage II sporulation protein P